MAFLFMPQSDAGRGIVRRGRQTDARVPTARDVQTVHGPTGTVHVPAQAPRRGPLPCSKT